MNQSRSHNTSLKPAGDATEVQDAALADDIHRQLSRILDSAQFRGSLRLTRFLAFVVATALAGRSEIIKAYTIAVEALGRGEDFDPQRDPIVRVEAGRLRQALARYYAQSGHDDPLMIELPRGTYVPVFRRVSANKVAPPLLPSTDDSPPTAHPVRWSEIVARRRECEMLHDLLSRQTRELAAEIKIARRALLDSQALLQDSDALLRRQGPAEPVGHPPPLVPAEPTPVLPPVRPGKSEKRR